MSSRPVDAYAAFGGLRKPPRITPYRGPSQPSFRSSDHGRNKGTESFSLPFVGKVPIGQLRGLADEGLGPHLATKTGLGTQDRRVNVTKRGLAFDTAMLFAPAPAKAAQVAKAIPKPLLKSPVRPRVEDRFPGVTRSGFSQGAPGWMDERAMSVDELRPTTGPYTIADTFGRTAKDPADNFTAARAEWEARQQADADAAVQEQRMLDKLDNNFPGLVRPDMLRGTRVHPSWISQLPMHQVEESGLSRLHSAPYKKDLIRAMMKNRYNPGKPPGYPQN